MARSLQSQAKLGKYIEIQCCVSSVKAVKQFLRTWIKIVQQRPRPIQGLRCVSSPLAFRESDNQR